MMMDTDHWFFRPRRKRAAPAAPQPAPERPRKSPQHLRKSGTYEGRIYRPLGESQTWSQGGRHRAKRPQRTQSEVETRPKTVGT